MRTPDGSGSGDGAGDGAGGEVGGDLAEGFGGFGDGDDDLTTGWGTGADDESFAVVPADGPADGGPAGEPPDVEDDELTAAFEDTAAGEPLVDPVADTYGDVDPYADGDHAHDLHGEVHGDPDVDGDGHPDGVDDTDLAGEAKSPFEFEGREFLPGGLFGHASD